MDRPTILLTGSRHDDQYRADVNGVTLWLPSASFTALVDLVASRIESENGSIHLERSTVHRLRHSLGVRAGKELIERAGYRQYCLAIPKTKIGQSVGVTACFFELTADDGVSAERAELLRKNCRLCTLSEND